MVSLFLLSFLHKLANCRRYAVDLLTASFTWSVRDLWVGHLKVFSCHGTCVSQNSSQGDNITLSLVADWTAGSETIYWWYQLPHCSLASMPNNRPGIRWAGLHKSDMLNTKLLRARSPLHSASHHRAGLRLAWSDSSWFQITCTAVCFDKLLFPVLNSAHWMCFHWVTPPECLLHRPITATSFHSQLAITGCRRYAVSSSL